jgi:hypothetical protein
MYPLPKPVSNKQVNYIHVPEYRNHVAVITGTNGLFDNLDDRTKTAITIGMGLVVAGFVAAMIERRIKTKRA